MFSHPGWSLCRWVWLYFPGPPLQKSCPPQTQGRPPGRPHSRSRSSHPRQRQYSHRNHSTRPRQCPRSCHRCIHHPRNHRSCKYQDHPHLRQKLCFIHEAVFITFTLSGGDDCCEANENEGRVSHVKLHLGTLMICNDAMLMSEPHVPSFTKALVPHLSWNMRNSQALSIGLWCFLLPFIVS